MVTITVDKRLGWISINGAVRDVAFLAECNWSDSYCRSLCWVSGWVNLRLPRTSWKWGKILRPPSARKLARTRSA